MFAPSDAMVCLFGDPPAKRVGGFDFDLDLGLEFEVGPGELGEQATWRDKPGQT